MAQWTFKHNGRKFGPYSTRELKVLATDGRLLPDDLVCRDNDGTWIPAHTVKGLFTTPDPVPTPVPEPEPERPRRKRAAPAWMTALLALPKPVLFGLFGLLGGLIGALLFGEPLWQLLSPAGLKQSVEVQAAAPESVRVYPGGNNRFFVKVARLGFTGPISVRVHSGESAIRVASATIPADRSEAEVEVEVGKNLAPGKYRLQTRLDGPDGKGIAGVNVPTTLNIELPPPALAVAVSPEVRVEQGLQARFVVKINRERFTGPVGVEVVSLPGILRVPRIEIPADQNEGTLELTTPRTISEMVRTGTVEVEAVGKPEVVRGSADFQVIVEKRRVPQADIVFVLDLTGSMGFAIQGIKTGVKKFVTDIGGKDVDARVGLVGFRDIQDDKERPFVMKVGRDEFTKDYDAFSTEVGRLMASGGGDAPESSLQGLALAGNMQFRTNASRVLVLITDVPPKIHPDETPSTVQQTVDRLKEKEVHQVHLLVPQGVDPSYQPFRDGFDGVTLDLRRAVASPAEFDRLLDTLGKDISRIALAAGPKTTGSTTPPRLPEARGSNVAPKAEVPALKAVQSTQVFAAKDRGWVLLAILVWTILVAAGISLALVIGQAFHDRQGWARLSEVGWSLAGGSLAGLVGGLVGQLVFQITSGESLWEAIARLLGWGFLGGLVGIVLALVVPNLKWSRGGVGGLIGGLLGAIGFLLVSLLVGSILGRWLGAAILGFFIGVMVALAELVFRRFWLEIAVGKHEVRTVTLGTTPVVLGGDESRVSFFVSGAEAVAMKYWIEGDRVRCEDVASGEVTDVDPGGARELGKVTITVRGTANSTATGFALVLTTGRSLRLQDGMPLTDEDLPGLTPSGKDGMVALVGRPPNRSGEVLLRNRSSQPWTAIESDGQKQTIEPGRSLRLAEGTRVRMGTVEGTVRREEK